MTSTSTSTSTRIPRALAFRSTTTPLVIVAAAVVIAFAFVASGCRDKPPKSQNDDNSKAFAELEKNDKDDPNQPKAPAPADDKPKGPVYPAPFTAEQIRDATKSGRTYRYKVEELNKPTKERVITFRAVDEGGAEVFAGGDTPKRMGWLTLQQHSEFPKDKVTTRDEKIKLPSGKFDCLVYEVAGEEGEVWTYYFARKLPGAPVYYYVERNGKRLRTTTLVEHIPGK